MIQNLEVVGAFYFSKKFSGENFFGRPYPPLPPPPPVAKKISSSVPFYVLKKIFRNNNLPILPNFYANIARLPLFEQHTADFLAFLFPTLQTRTPDFLSKEQTIFSLIVFL